MLRRVFSRVLSPRSDRTGYTLVELLIVLLLTSFMMTALTGFFRAVVAVRQNTAGQTEAQQGLRALASLITQELRQAGACLPRSGTFVSLSGTDTGLTDTLTLRIGLTDPTTGACLRAQLGGSGAVVGTTSLVVNSTAGFGQAKRLLVTSATTGAAEVYSIVSISGTSIAISPGLLYAKPASSRVYPLDERIYQLQTWSGRQVLTVSIDGGTAQPLVDGVTEFDVTYLGLPCDNLGECTALAHPTTDATWRTVREVLLSPKIASRKKDRQGQTVYTTPADPIRVKPRNLL